MTHRPLAFVTGASSGIGLELALEFARNGYDVAISGSSAQIFEAATSIEALGASAYPHRADAASAEGVDSFWQFIIELVRPVDAAALNVGIGLGGAFIDTALEDDLRVIAINISGTVRMAKHVARHMAAQGRGRILITSSVSATLPTPFETVYGPSKAFGFMFAESLREELKEKGVSVTALLPGATDSRFHKNAGMASSAIDQGHKNDKTLVARQGYEALMNGLDHVVGGDEETKRAVEENRVTPEPVKAARHARLTRLHS